MTTKDHRLNDLLTQLVETQQKQWNLMTLIESYITNNNGLTDAQTDSAYEAVRVLASAGDFHRVTEEEAEYFMQQVAKTGTIVRKPVVTVTPMEYDEFVRQYTAAYKEAGDDVPGDLTAAYAVYCGDPAGHFLHKEK